MLHSCLCLAIHTYSGQGSAKGGGVRSQYYTVVYSSVDTKPQPLPYENITIESFTIVLEEPGETIAPTSRLDFGKIYTVEHNLKILRIGRILPNHLPNLETAFVHSLDGTALARQELQPVTSRTQQRNCPSSIDWCDHLFKRRKIKLFIIESFTDRDGSFRSSLNAMTKIVFYASFSLCSSKESQTASVFWSNRIQLLLPQRLVP